MLTEGTQSCQPHLHTQTAAVIHDNLLTATLSCQALVHAQMAQASTSPGKRWRGSQHQVDARVGKGAL